MTDHQPHAKLPPHLRPPFSQRSSNTSHHSARSHSVHAQQHEFVPSFDPTGVAMDASLGERAMFEDAETAASPIPPTTPLAEEEEDEQAQDASGAPNDDWDTIREGSIARRPRWRRPSPAWVYPFFIGAALSLGMVAPPRQELYINLACLAHPPSRDSHEVMRDDDKFKSLTMMGIESRGWYHSTGFPMPPKRESDNVVHMPMPGGSIPSNMPISTPRPPLSPADKWFLRLQHDIHEYETSHNKTKVPSRPQASQSPLPTRTAGPAPTEPLPRPTTPYPGSPHPPIEAPVDSVPHDDTGESPADPDGNGPYGGGDSPYREIDPRMCKKDPKVQAAAAKLTMVMTLSMGILSALTTGFWGQNSDRWGRTKVMTIVELGLLLNELCFILVATFPYIVPGGYRALLVGPIIDGLLGGYSTISATINAYVSDTTPDGSRVTVFARMAGMAMLGFALGPVVGSALILSTGNIMTPFYVNLVIHSCFIPLIFFLLPESLSSDARLALAKNRALAKEAATRRDAAEREWEDETPTVPTGAAGRESDPLLSGWSMVSNAGHSRRRKKVQGTFKRVLRKASKPLQPLQIFLPTDRPDDGSGRKPGKNWNLMAVGLGIFFYATLMGILTVKGQFAFFYFGWSSTQLGPYLSAMAFTRGFVLIAVVPLIMRFVKPYFVEKDDEPNVDAEASQAGASAVTITSGTSSQPPAYGHSADEAEVAAEPTVTAKKAPKRSAHLDLFTIRVCLVLEFLPYVLLALGPSAEGFVVLSLLLTVASPIGPAANSLALALIPDASQSGRLFGALAVIQAMGTAMVSPVLFGTLFAATVGIYAPAIFAMASVMVLLSLLCYSCVRLDGKKKAGSGRDERGRSRMVKRVNSVSVGVGGGQSGFASVRSGYGATSTGPGSSALSTPARGH
ncbi:hypothetical protein IAR55_004135 [Kwoniella newhampshirensis]|uniref:Major facilitator superfamily (MFS) profile domain-containing protein n=1 Tax=Kwoniella newhampshirensis TaxID=1651941 RepID=A0AAW0YY43_9TREE